MILETLKIVATKISVISFALLSTFSQNLPFSNETRPLEITVIPKTETSKNINDNFLKIDFSRFGNFENLFPHVTTKNETNVSIEENRTIEISEKEIVEEKNSKETERKIEQEEIEKIKIVPTPKPLGDQTSFNIVLEETRDATVNILCHTNSSKIGSVTGSGIIIDPKGIILTNAHIAQLFLLDGAKPNFNVNCFIRTGNPAKPKYLAELLYISSTWIKKQSNTLIQKEPRGTGENDFALLHITEMYDKKLSLPENFPSIAVDTNYNPKVEDVLILSGYPAGLLNSVSIVNNLRQEIMAGFVTKLFSFNGDTVDLFQIKDSVVSQKGSSGGAIVTNKNKVGGIIVTSIKEDPNNSDSQGLRAITMSHINRAIITETNLSLHSFLSGNISEKAKIFKEKEIPKLSKILTEAIFK